MLKKTILLLGGLYFSLCYLNAQVVINEVSSETFTSIYDDEGDNEDWVELFNKGNADVSLAGYSMSDDPLVSSKFVFPDINIKAGQYLMVFASGKNRVDVIDHWESLVKETDEWTYTIPFSQPNVNWKEINGFNSSGWSVGIGGIGYGDDDDNTIIPEGSTSVFMRREFNVPDTSDIQDLVFHMDFDDGFVAYLNGQMIAVENLEGSKLGFDELAITKADAVMVEGEMPTKYKVPTSLLQNGTNVLAIQVHNESVSSSDLSARPFLHAAIKSTAYNFSSAEPWLEIPVAGAIIHTNFSLNNNGSENVYLYNALGTQIDIANLPELHDDITFGRTSDGGNSWSMLQPATPQASNNSASSIQGIWQDDVSFSIPAGFYSTTQSVTITCADPMSTVRYTTDGSKPSSSSSAYSGPVSVSSTESLRAGCFRSGYETKSSKIETNTYFIGDSHSLPVVSISTDPDGFFSEESGIYVKGPNADASLPHYGANFWEPWEREVHIEYFDKGKKQGFEQDLGAKIFGGWSRAQDMKSLRLIPRDRYGKSKIEYPLFSEIPHIDEFDQIVLRNSGNDFNSTQLRDAVNHRLQVGNERVDGMAYEPSIVYINGEYFGIHNIRERLNPEYVETHYGIDHKSVNFLERDGVAVQGSNASFKELTRYVESNDLTNQANYEQVKTMLNVENVIDYFAIQTYHQNGDWPHNNIRFWNSPENGGRWQYLYFDTDFGLNMWGRYPADNDELDRVIDEEKSVHGPMLKKLLTNEEFKCQFVNRYADLINTTFLPSNYKRVTDELSSKIASEIEPHHDKWTGWPDADSWPGELAHIKSYMEDRPEYARDFIEDQFSLAGQTTVTLDVLPEGAGKIKISTVKPDAYPWSGVYFDGCPVVVEAIANEGFVFETWNSSYSLGSTAKATVNLSSNGTITANFGIAPAVGKLSFSEVNYNSHDTLDAGDWVEFYNYGDADLDISGYVFKDDNDFNIYEFPVGTIVKQGEYIVIARDLVKFAAINPDVSNVVGPFDFKLSNGGERIRFFDNNEELKQEFTYSDDAPWPFMADGQGGTLEILDPDGDLDDPDNWYYGCVGGSPGTEYIDCPCESPLLGDDKLLCESAGGLVLDANISDPNAVFTWYLNEDEILNETASELTVVAIGEYKVMSNINGCIKESAVKVEENISFELGENADLCEEAGIELDPEIQKTGVSYKWELEGSAIATTPKINANVAGKYLLEAKYGDCPKVSGEITLSPGIAKPVDVTQCAGGVFDLSVIGNKNYEWFTTEVGGDAIASGKTFETPNLSKTTTYYVDDADAWIDYVGPKDLDELDPAVSEIWHTGTKFDHLMRFEVLQDVYLNYVTVYPYEPGVTTSSVTVRILNSDASVVVKEVTVAATSEEQRIYLGADLSTGKYYMDALGTNGELQMNGDDSKANYPYENEYVSIYRTEPEWAGETNGRYYFFYNWEISNNVQSCVRVPVTAYTCEQPDVIISADKTVLTTGENVVYSVDVIGEFLSLEWDFGTGAVPSTATGLGPHNVDYSSKGAKTVSVSVVTTGGVFVTDAVDIVNVCELPPVVDVVSSNSQFCGSAIELTAGLESGYDYTWYKGAVAISSATQNDNKIIVNETGVYKVVLEDPVNGEKCSRSSETVEVYECTEIEISANKEGVATGEEVTYSVSITGEFADVVWNFGSGAIPMTATGVGPHIVEYSTSGSKMVSVAVETLSGTFESESVGIVSVCGLPPVVEVVSSNSQFCGSTVDLTADLESGFDYTWYKGDVAISSATLNNNIISVSETGVFNVVLEDPVNRQKCSSSSETVEVYECTEIEISANKEELATGEEVTYSVSITGEFTDVVWNFGLGANPMTATGVGPHKVEYSTAGSKTVSVTVVTPGGTFESESIDVVTVCKVPPFVAVVSSSNQYCDAAVALTADLESEFNYSWYKGSVAITSPTRGDHKINVSETGVYKVVLEDVSNPQKCSRSSADVEIFECSDVKISANKSYAATGDEVTYSVDITGDVISVDWDFGTGATPKTVQGIGPHKVVYSTTGSKDVSVTVVTTGGTLVEKNTAIVQVCEVPPSVTVSTLSLEYCNEAVDLSTSLHSGFLYTWYKDGKAVSSPKLGGNSYEASASGEYSVKLDHQINPILCSYESDPVNVYECVKVNVEVTSSDVKTNEEMTFIADITGDTESITWDFGVGASPKTAVGAGPHNVVYSSAGEKDVKVTIETAQGTVVESFPAIVSVCSMPPSLDITATDVEYCEAGVQLSTAKYSEFYYTWLKDDIAVTAPMLGDEVLEVSEPGVYTLILEHELSATCMRKMVPVEIKGCVLGELVFDVDNKLSIYPNPVSSKLYIQGVSEKATVEIVSMSGEVVNRVEYLPGAELSLYGLSNGMYMINVIDGFGVRSIRVTKQ